MPLISVPLLNDNGCFDSLKWVWGGKQKCHQVQQVYLQMQCCIWKGLFVILAVSFLTALLIFKGLYRYWLISEQTCKVDAVSKYHLCFKGWEIEAKEFWPHKNLNWLPWEPGYPPWTQTSWSYLCHINIVLHSAPCSPSKYFFWINGWSYGTLNSINLFLIEETLAGVSPE